jgi:hypothetical protein
MFASSRDLEKTNKAEGMHFHSGHCDEKMDYSHLQAYVVAP